MLMTIAFIAANAARNKLTKRVGELEAAVRAYEFRTCTRCRRQNRPGANYCGQCGIKHEGLHLSR